MNFLKKYDREIIFRRTILDFANLNILKHMYVWHGLIKHLGIKTFSLA